MRPLLTPRASAPERTAVDDSVRQTLIKLRDEYGLSLLKDPNRLEAYLRDLAPGRNAEIHCLVSAVREGVVADLASATEGLPTAAVVARLAGRLHERLAMDENAAKWAVESLVIAMGRLQIRSTPVAMESRVAGPSADQRPISANPPRSQPPAAKRAAPRKTARRQPRAVGKWISLDAYATYTRLIITDWGPQNLRVLMFERSDESVPSNCWAFTRTAPNRYVSCGRPRLSLTAVDRDSLQLGSVYYQRA